MVKFEIINNPNEISLNKNWKVSNKFESKVVEKNGRNYRLVEKHERSFGCLERIGRGFLAIIVIVASLGFALVAKPVRNLLTKGSEKRRFGIIEAKTDNKQLFKKLLDEELAKDPIDGNQIIKLIKHPFHFPGTSKVSLSYYSYKLESLEPLEYLEVYEDMIKAFASKLFIALQSEGIEKWEMPCEKTQKMITEIDKIFGKTCFDCYDIAFRLFEDVFSDYCKRKSDSFYAIKILRTINEKLLSINKHGLALEKSLKEVYTENRREVLRKNENHVGLKAFDECRESTSSCLEEIKSKKRELYLQLEKVSKGEWDNL